MTATHEALSRAELQRQARDAYRASVERGEPLSRDELGAAFGMSASWGRDRIAEARQESDMSGDSRDTPPAVTPVAEAAPEAVEVTAAPDPAGPDMSGGILPVASDMSPVATPDTPALPPVATTPPPAVAEDVDTATDNRGDMSPDTPDMSPVDTPGQHHGGARFVCWLGFTLGTLVSVVANWLAAWLPAAQHAAGWRPDPWSQGFAAVWPLALLVSVEVLSRVAWPSGLGWALVRYGGMVAVALSSGVISYGHIHEVLLSWGYGALAAAVGPLVIDGLMVVSGFGLLVLSKSRVKY